MKAKLTKLRHRRLRPLAGQENTDRIEDEKPSILRNSSKTVELLNALRVPGGIFAAWNILDDQLGLLLSLWQIQAILVIPAILLLPRASRAIKDAVNIWIKL